MSADAHTAAVLDRHCRNDPRRWMMTRAVMTVGVMDIDTAKMMMMLTGHPAAYTLHYTHHGPHSGYYSEAAAAAVHPPAAAHPATPVDDLEPGDTECEIWGPCDVGHHHMSIEASNAGICRRGSPGNI